MKIEHKFIKKFGDNEYGLADLPEKISNVMISRIIATSKGECPYCFPHGPEMKNNRWANMERCWKRQRKTQWKGIVHE